MQKKKQYQVDHDIRSLHHKFSVWGFAGSFPNENSWLKDEEGERVRWSYLK